MADRPGGNTDTRVKGLIPSIFHDQLWHQVLKIFFFFKHEGLTKQKRDTATLELNHQIYQLSNDTFLFSAQCMYHRHHLRIFQQLPHQMVA